MQTSYIHDLGQDLALINPAGGLYARILTEVVSTDQMQWGLYTRPRSRFSHTDQLRSADEPLGSHRYADFAFYRYPKKVALLRKLWWYNEINEDCDMGMERGWAPPSGNLLVANLMPNCSTKQLYTINRVATFCLDRDQWHIQTMFGLPCQFFCFLPWFFSFLTQNTGAPWASPLDPPLENPPEQSRAWQMSVLTGRGKILKAPEESL